MTVGKMNSIFSWEIQNPSRLPLLSPLLLFSNSHAHSLHAAILVDLFMMDGESLL